MRGSASPGTRRIAARSAACDDPSLRAVLDLVAPRRADAQERLRGAGPTPAPATTPTAPRGVAPAAGTILAIVRPTLDLLRLRVARPAGFTYRPGQSVRLGLGGVRRRYTLVSAPHEPDLEFFIELVPGGPMSEHLRSLRAGDRLTVAGQAKRGIAISAPSWSTAPAGPTSSATRTSSRRWRRRGPISSPTVPPSAGRTTHATTGGRATAAAPTSTWAPCACASA